jgi:uncharacterized membrane protein
MHPTTPTLCKLAAEHAWPRDVLDEALAAARPGTAAWRRAISRLASVAAGLAFGVALVFFIAHNWAGMGRMMKFGLIELLLVAAVAVGIWRRNDAGQRHAAMLASFLILGALLAFTGQTYQTGADPWQLFAAWAALGVAFAAAAGHGFLWAVWLLTVNLALLLFFSLETRHGLSSDAWRITSAWIVGLNCVAFSLAVWGRAHIAAATIASHTASALALGFASVGLVVAILSQTGESGPLVGPLVLGSFWAIYLAASAWTFWLGWLRVRSVTTLSLIAISVFAVFNTLAIRVVFRLGDGFFALNLMAITLIGSAALLAFAVRRAAASNAAPATTKAAEGTE